jgi:hypothetical protein
MTPFELLQTDDLGFIDAQTRFKEIFCTLLKNHGKNLPEYVSCKNSLRTVDLKNKTHLKVKQPPKEINLKSSNNKFIIGLVPGIAWQCVRQWLKNDNAGPLHASKKGFDVRLVDVDGLSGSQNNAQQINHFFNHLTTHDSKRPIIIIAYSKGAVDTLYAISMYPELQKRVVAVVSVAGAIGGSPLARNTKQSYLNTLSYLPFSNCDLGDEKALESLYTDKRKKWLKANPLPKNIKYYSIITYPEPEQISLGLKPSYQILADIDPRNDGQLIFYDQLIPNASLLAFVNADHWALSIPVARQPYINKITFANKNKFPREILLEAILKYVEEDLKRL